MLQQFQLSRHLHVMSQISAATIEKYQEILRQDPRSKIFAALADAYREKGLFTEAETTARKGIDLHPEYIGGYVALGKLLCSQKRFAEALPFLNKAAQLSPENLLAHELLGQAFIELGKPQEALRAHKMTLFLHPENQRSRRAVEKLETLSAREFEDDLFQMSPLPKAMAHLNPSPPEQRSTSETQLLENKDELRLRDRQLSLIDALIVRHELEQASQVAEKLFYQLPEDPEVRKRWDLLKDSMEDASELRPVLSREKAVIEKQIQSLRKILKRLHEMQTLGG